MNVLRRVIKGGKKDMNVSEKGYQTMKKAHECFLRRITKQ
jgi:hypothetical protein